MVNQNQTKSNKNDHYDVAIIGAGINGAVAAAAASAAGLRVLVVDKGDIANFTSQESSNLVWGGIKYLQTYEFGLVIKLCLARNRLMRNYPNQIRQIGFLASLGPTAPFGRLLGTFGTLFYWGIGFFGTKAPASYSAAAAKRLEPNLISVELQLSTMTLSLRTMTQDLFSTLFVTPSSTARMSEPTRPLILQPMMEHSGR